MTTKQGRVREVSSRAGSGAAATGWLAAAVQGQSVSCTRKDTDRYGRMVAVCEVGRKDLSAEITRVGLARAYRRFSHDYVDEEAAARASGLGIWSDTRPVDTAAPLDTCRIKGNISSNGGIYHVPGSASYDDVRIDTARGERWFCTEEDARAAGWQPPRD